MSRIPSGPQGLGMDLTSTPATLSRQSISQQSDTLILERFTKEAEKLASQAPATGDLARSLQQAAEHARNLTRQLSDSADAARALGTNLKEAFTGLINAVKGATQQGGARAPSGISTAVVGGAITGVAIATITRSVATRIATSSDTRRAVERVGRAQLTRSQIESRTQAQQGGGLLSKLNDPNTTAKDIAGMGLPGVGKKEDSPTIKRLLEERDKRAFANEEEVSGRLKIGGAESEKGKALANALRGDDNLEARKPLTASEQVAGNAQDAQTELKKQLELERAREKFNTSKVGIANIKEQARTQKELNVATKAADWNKQVAEMGPLRANLSFLADKANEYGINLTNIGQIGKNVFAAGAGLIGSTSAIANPVEWQTFKRSIEGVAASVGTIFSPILNEMSGYLQRAADWFDSLSESTKAWLGRTTVGITIAGGLVFALSRIGPMVATAVIGMYKLAASMIAVSMANPVTAILTVTGVVAGLAATWFTVGENARNGVRAMLGVNQIRPVVAEEHRRRQISEIVSDPAARQRIATAGTPEETEAEIARYRETLNQRIIQAERTRLAAVGRQAAEQQRMETEHAESIPQSRQRLAAWEREMAPIEEGAVKRLRRQSAIERIAETEFPYQSNPRDTDEQRDARLAFVRAQRERLVRQLTDNRDPGVGLSPGNRAAQARLDELNAERTKLNTELGAGNPLRQSLQNLLPAAQAFTDPAQIGEQIALKSMEARGEQDIKLALQRLVSIADALGTNIRNIDASTNWENMIRLMGGFTGGR